MLHPSYTDLMKVANSEVNEGEAPVVNSRYSIVMATAKRARELIDGAPALVYSDGKKPLSIAVEELDKLSQDPKEREKYEEREWSIMRYNAEMETNREIGEKIGEERGKKTEKMKKIKKLFEKNMKIDEIAEIVELNVEEVKSILENKK